MYRCTYYTGCFKITLKIFTVILKVISESDSYLSKKRNYKPKTDLVLNPTYTTTSSNITIAHAQ